MISTLILAAQTGRDLPPARLAAGVHEDAGAPAFQTRKAAAAGPHRPSAGLDVDLRPLADGPVLRQFLHAHIDQELAGLAVRLAAQPRDLCPGNCVSGSERKTMRAGWPVASAGIAVSSTQALTQSSSSEMICIKDAPGTSTHRDRGRDG